MDNLSLLVKEEYFSRYNELYYLILRGYIDYSCINIISNSSNAVRNSQPFFDSAVHNVLGHICEVLKSDLALTLWKVYYDDHGASTVGQLKKFFYTTLKKAPRAEPQAINEKQKQKVGQIRSEFLAHNLLNKSGVEITLAELKEQLDEAKSFLNILCDPTIDPRVKEISDTNLRTIENKVRYGLETMIANTAK